MTTNWNERPAPPEPPTATRAVIITDPHGYDVQAYADKGHYLYRDTQNPIKWLISEVHTGRTEHATICWRNAKEAYADRTGVTVKENWCTCKGTCLDYQVAQDKAGHVITVPVIAAAGAVVVEEIAHHQENRTMCETRQIARETNCDCYTQERQQQNDQLTNAIAKGTVVLAMLAVTGSLLVLASAFLATMAAVTSLLYLIYNYRRQLGAVALATFFIATSPFRFFTEMVGDGIEQMKYEQMLNERAQAETKAITATGVRMVEPLLLSDKGQSTPIEFAQRTPVYAPVEAK